MRTKQLITLGKLVAKANLEFLSTNAILGACIFAKQQLDRHPNIIEKWELMGEKAFSEDKSNTTPVIITFEIDPGSSIKNHIRACRMHWNSFRSEWYGHVPDLERLKLGLRNINYKIDIL